MLDYIRIGCAVPGVQVADTVKNTRDICAYIARAAEENCDIVVFPELAVTGYTCADLFFQEKLLQAVAESLSSIAGFTADYPGLTAVVGAPVVIRGQMYNCAAVMSGGRIRGIVPKTYLPGSMEFSENRWFSSARELPCGETDNSLFGYAVPVGTDLLFTVGDAVMGAEICQDLQTPIPPSSLLTLQGAEIIVNLSASNEILGKSQLRRELVKHQSQVCHCVYAYVSSGSTESGQDLLFSGHSLVCENGTLLAEKRMETDYLLVRDADLGKVRSLRRKNKTLQNTAFHQPVRYIPCTDPPLRGDGSLYTLRPYPFVPQENTRQEECRTAFCLQVAGLARRLQQLGCRPVVGVSGGLDSTLALLAAVEAVKKLGRPASYVCAVTMPSFGTSGRTYENAVSLMKLLGVTVKEVDIREAVNLHFKNIGHDPAVHNATYENAQARERTQVLMDYAGVVGGIVVGTGDLSELALGWCTYNGDHMSMYSVNASIPKTLIPWIIRAVAEMPDYQKAARVLEDIIDTPISPELLPPDETGKLTQQTEDLVGPYALHDFFLYYLLSYEFAPGKIYALACRAFAGVYDEQTVKKWLKVFYRRFFTQQFKRSCMPEGVKVCNVSLNPRGDWRMPSDAAVNLWLSEIDSL